MFGIRRDENDINDSLESWMYVLAKWLLELSLTPLSGT